MFDLQQLDSTDNDKMKRISNFLYYNNAYDEGLTSDEVKELIGYLLELDNGYREEVEQAFDRAMKEAKEEYEEELEELREKYESDEEEKEEEEEGGYSKGYSDGYDVGYDDGFDGKKRLEVSGNT